MMRTGWSRCVLLGAALVLAATSVPQAATKNAQVTAKQGMVASAHPLASQAGLDILKAGGNAVDAAVAAAFAIGVAEPNATGIGGEGMMVIYLARTKTAVAIDYRSAAPAVTNFEKGIPATGHAAIAIPGTVAGLTTALERYGTMKLPQVMAPAIKLAADGFAVSPTLNAIITDSFEGILKNEPLAKIVAPQGLPLEAGATLRNPDLAATLTKIASGGADAFYRGDIAEAIAAEMAAHGGFITKADLAAYRAAERAPVKGTYRGVEIWSAPPPVGGLAVLDTLHVMEQFDFRKYPSLSATRIHLMAEAMKRSYADFGAFIADPGFVKVPTEWLLSRAYAKSRAATIRPDAISEHIEAGDPPKLPPSTTSLSVVDKAGNMVALTQTISDFFGAKVVVAGTGIIFNNEMKNFSRQGINALAPGKRMRTTISPTILLRKGRAFGTIGTPGAARILTTMAELVSYLVDDRMGLQEAIEAPRFFPADRALSIEPRFPAATVEALKKMGYTITPMRDVDMFFGGAQGIVIDQRTGLRIGGADPRRDGAVVGY